MKENVKASPSATNADKKESGKIVPIRQAGQTASSDPFEPSNQTDEPEPEGNMTDFSGDEYLNMKCGDFTATDEGIFMPTRDGLVKVLPHPVLPVRRLVNIETGMETIVLAFKRNASWKEITVPKQTIASGGRIVSLADLGVGITSVNAKGLVMYLSEVESLNEDIIPVVMTTSRYGWKGDSFVPYDDDYVFIGGRDNEHEQVDTIGSEQKWTDHMRTLRKGNKMIRIAMAAACSSVLVPRFDELPFIVDFFGITGCGKSVLLKVAASIFANPAENRYIGDYEATQVGLEVKCDRLNHLPLMLDDSSKGSAQLRSNLEKVVYNLCAGKGRSRSNPKLTSQIEKTWQNCTLTNGERQLRSYVQQGGAINRILEFECTEELFEDPTATLAVITSNYGHAGRRFVQAIQREYTPEQLEELRQAYLNEVQHIAVDNTAKKQMHSIALVLTADKILTDEVFDDELYLEAEDLAEALTTHEELSDNERCYQYLLEQIAMSPNRFREDSSGDFWGSIEGGYAIIISSALEKLCSQGGFSKKSFLSWAAKSGAIKIFNGKTSTTKRFGKAPSISTTQKDNRPAVRCVYINLDLSDSD